MNIQDALKETGKAIWQNKPTEYVAWKDGDIFAYSIGDNEETDRLKFNELLIGDWRPYQPKEEIMPSEAGELWEHKGGSFPWAIYQRMDERLGAIYCGNKQTEPPFCMSELAHNQNGWKRLHPPVNDGEVIDMFVVGDDLNYKSEHTRFHNGYNRTVEVTVRKC